MELYEQIRREYEFGVGTIQGVARQLGVYRRMVRDAVRNALPEKRKKPQRPRTKLAPATAFIDAILVNDRKEPRKQRHTAHRIWQRMREELGVEVAGRTVRQYVQQRKRELGVETAEVFIAQSYDWGQEAQVDWYEAWVDLAGERVKLQVFAMRAMASRSRPSPATSASRSAGMFASISRLGYQRRAWGRGGSMSDRDANPIRPMRRLSEYSTQVLRRNS